MTIIAAEISPSIFSGSYDPSDVQFLLKPSQIAHIDVHEKERLIQSGAKHYSEMLSAEKVPDDRYLALYHEALHRNAARLNSDVNILADAIASRPETQNDCVVISLVRAGTPIGVLLKRALTRRGVNAIHYSVSIIRGRGIDLNALRYIYDRHGSKSAVFVDGWTGKGAIKGELIRALQDQNLGFKPYLAVIADPAGCADLAATNEDYLIPSGLLNGIVSGLVSRSVLSDELVGPNDFHACLFQKQHQPFDVSQSFIDIIEAANSTHDEIRPAWTTESTRLAHEASKSLLDKLANTYGISDVNLIKPGLAEATRAVLRRVPDMVFIKDPTDPEVQHIVHLANKAGVPVQHEELHNYRAATVIKKLLGEQE